MTKRAAFIVIVDHPDDCHPPPCIGDIAWALPRDEWKENGNWKVHVTDLSPEMLKRHFPAFGPCLPFDTSPPSGPRMHPKHHHDIDDYGPSCYDVGCPRWCWSGHPSMSWGEDDSPLTPDEELPLTPDELNDLLVAMNRAEYRQHITWDQIVARPGAARELIALEKDGDGDQPPVILGEMARRGATRKETS